MQSHWKYYNSEFMRNRGTGLNKCCEHVKDTDRPSIWMAASRQKNGTANESNKKFEKMYEEKFIALIHHSGNRLVETENTEINGSYTGHRQHHKITRMHMTRRSDVNVIQ